ncbi:hypothetical protein H0O02_05140 [Candidatus Micrarchaeota archaeon]|nr:hypothetical protein [Candidatus Micrarchaeota archaeon]
MRFRLKRRVNDAERPEAEMERQRHGGLRKFAGALLISGIMALGGCQNDATQNAPEMQAYKPPATGQVRERVKKLLVLTREKFKAALNDYVDGKKSEGYEVRVATLEEIPQTGRDVPESIRNFLKQEKESNGLDYLLIVGDTDADDFAGGAVNHAIDKDWEIPMRYVSVEGKPYSEGPAELEDGNHDSVFPTDQYYASLGGTWDNDGDGIYGEAGAMSDEFDFSYGVSVGRLPVRTPEELAVIIDTTSKWEAKERPVHSVFEGKYCDPGYTQEDRERIAGNSARGQLPEVKEVKMHVCNSDPGGDIAEFLNVDGADFATSVSHGWFHGITLYGNGGNEYGYRLDYMSATIAKPPIYFAYACLVGAIDQPNDVLAEYLLKKGQVVAFIGATRSHADITFDFWNGAYFEKHYRIGDALYGYKEWLYSTKAMNSDEKANLMMFTLFGDPTLPISKRPEISVSVPGAIEIEAYYPDVPVFLTNNSESAMNVRSKYVTSTIDLEIFDDHVASFASASFAFEHHLDSTLQKYLDARIVVENDSDAVVSVSRVTFFSRHIVKGPDDADVRGGREVTVPVLVLYGNDESVAIKAEFYPGCYENCMPDEREHFEVFSGTFSLADGRKLPVTFTAPLNSNPYIPGSNYTIPQIEFSCEECSGGNPTYVYYIE